MRYPSKLMASSQISLLYRDGVCEKSAALLMSSFHLTFLPLVVLDAFIFGTYATSSQNCSHAEMGGHSGGRTVVTPMWWEHVNDCLFAVLLWMIDSGLKMVAWHNYLPARVFNLHPLMDSGFLSCSLFVYPLSDLANKCVGLREVEAFTLLWVIQCSYDNDYDDKANEWVFSPIMNFCTLSDSNTLSRTIPFTQQPLSLRPLKLALSVRWDPNCYRTCRRAEA